MTIEDGVRRYVDWKRDNGFRFEQSERTLLSFSKLFPGLLLKDITPDHVLGYLNRRPVSVATWRFKHSTLARLFEHWSYRGEVGQLVMPTKKPYVRPSFVPFVFTTSEIHALLTAVTTSHNTHRYIDPPTLRSMLLVLYATGASIGELALIQGCDLDLEGGYLNLTSTRPNRSRRIPIGADLCRVLEQFLASRPHTQPPGANLFVTKQGLRISTLRFGKHFRRLRRFAGVRRRDGDPQQPRVNDLRYTFAVHRITRWIEEGFDLDRMLPALAAYMGQIGLGATERYLLLTPERFRKDLDKLSPVTGRGLWGDNNDLMRFLVSL